MAIAEKQLSTSWSKAKEFKKPFEYTTELGKQECILRRIDMGDLLKLGMANEFDFMSKALMQSEKKPEDKVEGEAEKTEVERLSEIVRQGENYGRMEVMVFKTLVAGMISPKVYDIPEHENARQDGLLYADDIPWDDRMELFGVIFDSEGLATFRQEQTPSVGDVADVSDVPLPADGPVDIRPDDSEGVLLQQGSVPVRANG